MCIRFTIIVFFFYLGALFPSIAQTFSWREPGMATCYKVDFFTSHLYQSNKDGRWDDMGPMNFQDVKLGEVYWSSEGINPVKIQGQSGTFLIMECSGQVYRFVLATKTLKREDLTFYRGANCQAVQFARKNELYSLGGYGFWQSTNIMTKYNSVSKDWQHILASGDIPKSIHKHYGVYLAESDKFIQISSSRINQTESAEVLDIDYGIYDYSFSDKRFKRLGEVYEPTLRQIISYKRNNFILTLGRYIIISPYEMTSGYNHDLLYIIDTQDSYKGYLWTNPARYQIRKFNEERGVIYSVYVRGQSIFLPQVHETYPYGAYQVAEVPIKTLLAESKYLGPVMDKPLLENIQQIALAILGVILLIVILRFLVLLKHRKKKQQLDLLLGVNERQFLDFLRLNYRQGHVSGHQIVAFFGKHKSSPESQRQFRAKLIDGLTKSLGLVFPGEQVLDIQADEKDQRMLTYRLTDTIYKELKKL